MSVKTIDVVVAGYLGVDVICDFDNGELVKHFRPGKLFEIDKISFSPGGVVANTGAALKKFGQRVHLMGLLGDDLLGRAVKNNLIAYGLSDGVSITNDGNSACGIVISPKDVDRIFLEYPGCNHLFDLSHIDFETVSQSRLFHFGYPPLLKQFYSNNGRQLSELFARVKKLNVLTSLDFSLPDTGSESGKVNWPEILRNTLPYVDIFVPSIEEAIQVVVPELYQQLSQSGAHADFVDHVPFEMVRKVAGKILHLGAKAVLIKMAHRGAYLATGDVSVLRNDFGLFSDDKWNQCELSCTAYPLDQKKVKNASGAGDTAVAAFLTAILNNETPQAAIQLSNIAGRNNLYCMDIYEELENWESMKEEQLKGAQKVKVFTPVNTIY